MAERDDPSGRAQMAAAHLAEHHCWVASEDMRGLILETLSDYAGVIGQVDPSSLVVRADRTSGACRRYDVTFLTDTDRSGSFLVGAVVDERGRLRPAGSAGGAGAPPTRERLWINLAGWWGGDESGAQLWAGGEVLGPGTERVHDVLLRFPDGSALQDTPTAGVVLFLGEGAQDLDAAEVVIRDDRGQVLARHQAR